MCANAINRLTSIALPLAVVAAAIAWLIVSARRDLNDGVVVLDAYEAELNEMLNIVQSNPHICFVSLDRPIDVVCPDAKSIQDRKDYARVNTLMRRAGLNYLDLWRDDSTGDGTHVLSLEFEIFAQPLIPSRGPIVGVWHGPIDVQGRKGCKRARQAGWFACEARAVYAP